MKKINAYWIIGGALVISVLISSSFSLIKSSFYYLFSTNNYISVTGSSTMDFTSDLIVWGASFTKKDVELKNAYKQIKKDRNIINDFLLNEQSNSTLCRFHLQSSKWRSNDTIISY